MQEAEQLHDEIDEILNEFFPGDKPIPERTCGVDKRNWIWDEDRYKAPSDVSSSLAPEVA